MNLIVGTLSIDVDTFYNPSSINDAQ